MDISMIDGAFGAQFSASAQMNRETSETESFQSVLEKAVDNKDMVELRKACVDFEGYFIQMMYKEMRKTVHSEGGIFPKSHTEEIFQDMLDEETSKNLANTGGIGLANMLYKQLSRNIDILQ